MLAKVSLMLLMAQNAQTATQTAVPAAPKADAGVLISKAFARYDAAQTVSGTIRLIQEAKGISVQIDTELQYERPSKIYLRQVKGGSDPQQSLLVSDGIKFSFDKPLEALGPARFTEDVTQKGRQQSVGDLYAAWWRGHRCWTLSSPVRRTSPTFARTWGPKR